MHQKRYRRNYLAGSGQLPGSRNRKYVGKLSDNPQRLQNVTQLGANRKVKCRTYIDFINCMDHRTPAVMFTKIFIGRL